MRLKTLIIESSNATLCAPKTYFGLCDLLLLLVAVVAVDVADVADVVAVVDRLGDHYRRRSAECGRIIMAELVNCS